MENYLKQFLVTDKNMKKFIHSYSILKHTWNRKEKPKLFPLTSGHIIINFGDGYIIKDGEKVLDIEDHLVFYPSTKTLDVIYKTQTCLVGIEFSPQGLYYLNKEKSIGNLNSISHLNVEDKKLYKIINENKEELLKENFDILNDYFNKKFSKYFLDNDLLLIDSVLSKISIPNILIKDIAIDLEISSRTLERKFKKNTGMTLKKYQLIFKLNKLLEEIYMININHIDWGELSVKYGFYDQPHMIKELKKYLGRSPREYLKNRDLLGDLFEKNDVFLQ